MRRFLLSFCALVLTISTSFSQELVGDWTGVLNVMGQELPLNIHIQNSEGNYTGTMDSPEQKSMGIPLNDVVIDGKNLSVAVSQINMKYTGTLNTDGIVEGTFTQNGMTFPLKLEKGIAEAKKKNRPQEPKAPFPYNTQDVTFTNNNGGHTLAGTLSIPKVIFKGKKKLPAVILISGSGPQNRDEELLGHKPFLVLADYLTRQGIAVLRYDDRGTAKSTGDFASATSADFATDAQAAFEYLTTHPDISSKKIGFAGHSEGGLIAPMVAAENPEVAFIALLAGVGMPGDELLVEQGYLIGKAQGMPEDELRKNRIAQTTIFKIIKDNYGNKDVIETKIRAYLEQALKENPEMIPDGLTAEIFISQQMGMVATDWFQYLITVDPNIALSKVKCPVLAINGSLDLQVPPQQNLSGIEKNVKKGGNNDVTIVEIPNLNHLFQTTTTGSPSEYESIEETFAPEALKIIGDWLKEKTK